MTIATARIRALRAFAYSLDGVRLIAVAPGEEVSLRAGAAAGLVAEGYAEPAVPAPQPPPTSSAQELPTPADLLSTAAPAITGDAPAPRRRRVPDRRT